MNKKGNSVVFSVALPTEYEDLHRIIDEYVLNLYTLLRKIKIFSIIFYNSLFIEAKIVSMRLKLLCII